MQNNKTIVALATPQGVGALAVIRITGKKAFCSTEKIIEEKEKFNKAKEREIGLYTIIEGKKVIDEVTLIKYKKPNTYTGEDLVEIIAHGGNYPVKNIIKVLLKEGVQLAQRGEFSKRAFLNGKINLLKAEAIRNLIDSRSEEEYENGIAAYKDAGKRIEKWKEKIEEELTQIEAEIEFGEEEHLKERKDDKIKRIEKEIGKEIKRAESIKNDEDGIYVVISGPSNAGKSSFFNYLLGYERAIINKIKGTTRDILREKIYIKDKEITVVDTAGIRKTKCEIEKVGIEKTKELLKEKIILVWISDISEEISEEEKRAFEALKNKDVIIILNKSDQKKREEKEKYYKEAKKEIYTISLKENKNSNDVIKAIERRVSGVKKVKNELFINERHLQIAKKSQKSIKKAIKNWKQKEITAYYLNETLQQFEELLGKNSNEKVINEIFNKFCIGK